MPERRSRGALEAEVLDVLWSADAALTPAEVQAALGRPLAYTTVLTILQRLHIKGQLTREVRGRGHAYRPVLSRLDAAATRMEGALADVGDRKAVLSRFVAKLRPADVAALRDVLTVEPGRDR